MILKIENVFYIDRKLFGFFFEFFWWVVSRTITPQLEHTYSSDQFPLLYIRVEPIVVGTILGNRKGS